MYENELKKLGIVLQKYNELSKLENKADRQATELLAKEVLNLFASELPFEYTLFLQECDGFEFNGYILYGTENFIDNNWNLNDCSDEYIYFADYDIGWFVMRKSDSTFWELDKSSGEEIGQFNDMAEMIKHIILESIKQ